jgi:hypothetical protein
LHCHIILMNLRPAGTKVRKIPHGNVFSFVACANYFWESIAWLAFAIFTQTVTSYLFFLFSAGQMLVWASTSVSITRSLHTCIHMYLVSQHGRGSRQFLCLCLLVACLQSRSTSSTKKSSGKSTKCCAAVSWCHLSFEKMAQL